jgi:hypothetical protein
MLEAGFSVANSLHEAAGKHHAVGGDYRVVGETHARHFVACLRCCTNSNFIGPLRPEPSVVFADADAEAEASALSQGKQCGGGQSQ